MVYVTVFMNLYLSFGPMVSNFTSQIRVWLVGIIMLEMFLKKVQNLLGILILKF